MDPYDIPIYVNVRDRLTDLRDLVAWLERAGHQRIVFLDNRSTYEPLLEYLQASPHQWHRLMHNHGARALWLTGYWRDAGPFILTDPDVVPTEGCPLDLVERLCWLQAGWGLSKVGVGLTMDDTPVDMPSRDWELGPSIRGAPLCPEAYHSLVDTTFALYRGGTEFCYEAVRTTAPYEVRHMPWYRRPPWDEEHLYYFEHARYGPLASSWEPTRERAQ